jgi:hypothetical protein
MFVGFTACLLNCIYLLVRYRFFIDPTLIRSVPIVLGFLRTDTNSLVQSSLLTLLIFLARSLWVYSNHPYRFISVVGDVGLVVTDTPLNESKALRRTIVMSTAAMERLSARLHRAKQYTDALNMAAGDSATLVGSSDVHSNNYR